MANSISEFGRISLEELKGLNERQIDANTDIGEFDVLRGFVPTKQNTLTKIQGTKLMHVLSDGPILNLSQANDSRGNIWIQCEESVGAMFDDEFFQRPVYVPNLDISVLTEEEDMSCAIITHSTASAVDGGTYTTLNTWQQAPLTEILSQLNPDGSAAAFASLAANQFTLVAGVYRIWGWRVLRNSNTGTGMHARVWNVTAGTPAFVGLANEKTAYIVNGDAHNHLCHFCMGTLNLGGSTVFEIQGHMSQAQATNGFGLASPVTGSRNIWSQINILKTS